MGQSQADSGRHPGSTPSPRNFQRKTITYSYHCLSEFLRVTELGCIHRVPLNCLLGRSVKLCDLDTGTARW
jgi:hypothetical protein